MNASIIDPLTLPSLPLGERSQLPNCPAIYFALDGDCVLYVGRTAHLAQRWLNHHRWNQLAKMSGNVRVAWLECTDSALLPEIEAALIKHFQPTLNQTASAGKVNIYFNEEEEVYLYEAIVGLAKREKRSINQQIKILLTEAMETRQEKIGDTRNEEGAA